MKFQRIGSFLRAIPRTVVGDVKWTPPAWLAALCRILGAAGRWCLSRLKAAWNANPRRMIATLALVVAVVAGAGVGVRWWLTRPAPVFVKVTVSGAEPMDLKDGARPRPLSVVFDAPCARVEDVGHPIGKGVTLDPPVDGEWRWVSDTQLLFQPATEWAIGTTYTIGIDRGFLVKPRKLADYTLEFSTRPFEVFVAEARIDEVPEDPSQRRCRCVLKFSHPADPVAIEQALTLNWSGDAATLPAGSDAPIPYRIAFDAFKGHAYVTSSPFPLPPDDAEIRLRIAPEARAAGGSPLAQAVAMDVDVPGAKSVFQVKDVSLSFVENTSNELERVLVVTTSLPVKSSDLLTNLTAWILPSDLSAEQVGPAILAKSRPVVLHPIPSDSDRPTTNGFRLDVAAGSSVYVRVEPGLAGPGGFRLVRGREEVLDAADYPRQLQIQLRGALLSLGGEHQVSILSRGVRKVRFTVGRLLPGRVQQLVTETDSMFDPLDFDGSLDEANLTELFTETRTLKDDPGGKPRYLSFDFTPYLRKKGAMVNQGVFFFNVEDASDEVEVESAPEDGEDTFDSSDDYQSYRNVGDQRLVLLTDLGLVVKENLDRSRDVFVQGIRSGQPVEGVRVQVLGRNGLPIASAQTDASGHARFPSLASFERERAPTVWYATRDNDIAFLPYRGHHDRSVDLWEYDVGGIDHPAPDALAAYLFTDRGLYRPGETAQIAFIVKSASWSPVAGVPIEVVVMDPRGIEVLRKRMTLSRSGFDAIPLKIGEDAATGGYSATVHRIRTVKEGGETREETEELGDRDFTVEEFLPDRMKIHATLNPAPLAGWVKPDGLKSEVALENLYGTPAAGRRVTGEVTLRPGIPRFDKFKGFVFVDPLRKGEPATFDLGEKVTDDAGRAAFDVVQPALGEATYRLTFSAKGFEAHGGRGVTASASVLVSPLSYLLGYRCDETLAYVPRDGRRTLDLIAVSPDMQKVEVGDLKATLYSRRWLKVLASDYSGTFRYESALRELPVRVDPLRIGAAGTPWTLRTDRPGDWALVVTDARGVELTRVLYSVAGEGDLGATRGQASAKLEATIDRESREYAPGETIRMTLKAPFAGAGLITIEKDRVYGWSWFNATGPSSEQQIQVPADLEGNGYVVVTYLRSIDSREIFASPLATTVVPFTVSRQRRTVDVRLDVPAKLRPGTTAEIRYRTDRPSRIALYAVDEGILQVARYRLPDPLSRFLEKESHEVDTRQNLDLVLPERSIQQAATRVGGDEGSFGAGRHLNPFRRKGYEPVVYWSGILEAGPHDRVFKVALPDSFNGTLRVMAVAVAPDAVGVASAAGVVRSPLVLLPDAPTNVAPGDRFEVGLTLEYLPDEGGAPAADVAIDLVATPPLEIEGDATKKARIVAGRWVSIPFKVRASDAPGVGSLVFRAQSSASSSRHSLSIGVRPLTPQRLTTSSGRLFGGTTDVAVPRRMFPFGRLLEASASVLPVGLARGLSVHLDDYPYACTEQTVSRAFAALALRDWPELGPPSARAQEAVDRAIETLRERQNVDGSFGMWAANGFVSSAQTVYALHFLTELTGRGRDRARPILERGLGWLETFEPDPKDGLEGIRTQAYAAYVLARNEKIPTNALTSARDALKARFPAVWQGDLAAAYLAATYRILKQNDEAERLIAAVTPAGFTADRRGAMEDRTVRTARLLYLVVRHFPERLSDPAVDLLGPLVDRVGEGGATTLSSATAILALTAYARAKTAVAGDGPGLSEILADGTERALAPSGGLFPKAAFSPEAAAVRVAARAGAPLFYQVVQRGYDLAVPAEPIRNGIEVATEVLGPDGRPATRVQLGDEVEVRVTFRATDEADCDDVVIVAPFPGGFEPVRGPAQRTAAPGANAWSPMFVDPREDLVLAFGTVPRNASVFSYRLTAVTAGDFAVPPAFAEAMYDPSVHGMTTAGRIVIVDKP